MEHLLFRRIHLGNQLRHHWKLQTIPQRSEFDVPPPSELNASAVPCQRILALLAWTLPLADAFQIVTELIVLLMCSQGAR